MVRAARMKRTARAVRVGPTGYGRGLFARRRFRPTETIAEVGGTPIEDPQYESTYCMHLDGDWVLEPAAPFRYLNHSCRPNCELVYSPQWDEAAQSMLRTLFLISLADIGSGEQLTIDYAWPATRRVRCLCGSPDCRGWIVAYDELDAL